MGKTFEMTSIGKVHSRDGEFLVHIDKEYRPALKELDQFSHVLVFWWADRADTDEGRKTLQCHPPYARDRLTGIFATRSEYRPNPIAVTTAYILSIDEAEGTVQLAYIDAFDGSDVVDLKAYFPVSDRPRTAHYPEWLSDWPKNIPEEDWSPEWMKECEE